MHLHTRHPVRPCARMPPQPVYGDPSTGKQAVGRACAWEMDTAARRHTPTFRHVGQYRRTFIDDAACRHACDRRHAACAGRRWHPADAGPDRDGSDATRGMRDIDRPTDECHSCGGYARPPRLPTERRDGPSCRSRGSAPAHAMWCSNAWASSVRAACGHRSAHTERQAPIPDTGSVHPVRGACKVSQVRMHMGS